VSLSGKELEVKNMKKKILAVLGAVGLVGLLAACDAVGYQMQTSQYGEVPPGGEPYCRYAPNIYGSGDWYWMATPFGATTVKDHNCEPHHYDTNWPES